MAFEPGFLGPSFFNFASSHSPDVMQVDSFRRLGSLYGEISTDDLKKFKGTAANEPKALKNFYDEFGKIKILDRHQSWSLMVDDKKINVPVMVAGNQFVRYIVLDSVTNPLILSISFDPREAPEKALIFMNYFHENMEYQITQVKTK